MNKLTTEQITALPVGATMYDCDGDQLIQVAEGRWGYTHLQDADYYGPKDGPVSGLTFGPYRTQPGLLPEELEAVPVGFQVLDSDGDDLTRREGGYSYTKSLARDGWERAFLMRKFHLLPSGPFTLAPLTPAQLDALPVGTRIKDRDREELTRRAEGWVYTDEMAGLDAGADMSDIAIGRPALYAPYVLVLEVANNA